MRVPVSSLILCIITCFLLYICWFALFSAGNGNPTEWANKQIVAALYMLPIPIIVGLMSTKILFRISTYFLFTCILLLIVAEFKGHTAMGAQRWVKVGGISLQPSELTKIGVILVLSKMLSKLTVFEIGRFRNLILPIIMSMVPASIILKQPNLGTSTILVLIACSIFFAAGVRIWKFVLLVSMVITSAPIIWHFMHDYQRRRIMTFLNPEQDLLGDGYNIMQSKIAIGSGGLEGKGLMQGSQVQLSFLPEKHTDFVFTILAEEWGFYGVFVLLFTYLLLISLRWRIGLPAVTRP